MRIKKIQLSNMKPYPGFVVGVMLILISAFKVYILSATLADIVFLPFSVNKGKGPSKLSWVLMLPKYMVYVLDILQSDRKGVLVEIQN